MPAPPSPAGQAVGHTATPWYVGAQNDALFIIDSPPSPAPVDNVNVGRHLWTKVIAKSEDGSEQAIVDFRMIVRAVNAHADLVALVRAMVKAIDKREIIIDGPNVESGGSGPGDPAATWPWIDEWLHYARAALARAEGGRT